MTAEDPQRYTQRPCYPELVAVACAGLLHIVAEIALSEMVARAYNVLASVGFLVYVIWRARVAHGALRAWGMRRDKFWSALRAQLGFGAFAAFAIVGYGLCLRTHK